MKHRTDSYQKMLLSSVIMIVKGFCVRTCTRSEIWMGMTTSRKIVVDARSVTLKSVLDTCYNSHCLPWTHYAHCHDTRVISIWASNFLHFLKLKRLWMTLVGFATFRGSHWSENEDESRDAALTIHVNVDEVARHSTVRNSWIVTLLDKLSCRKQRERRQFEEKRRARSSRICSVGQTANKDHYRLRQWSSMRKDQLTLVQVSFDSWRNVVSRFISHWIVLCKFGYIKRSNAHTRHANHKNNQRHIPCTQRDELHVSDSITRTTRSAHIKNVTQTTHNQIDEWADDKKFNERFFSVQFGIGPFFFPKRTDFSSLMCFFHSFPLSHRVFLSLRLVVQYFQRLQLSVYSPHFISSMEDQSKIISNINYDTKDPTFFLIIEINFG